MNQTRQTVISGDIESRRRARRRCCIRRRGKLVSVPELFRTINKETLAGLCATREEKWSEMRLDENIDGIDERDTRSFRRCVVQRDGRWLTEKQEGLADVALGRGVIALRSSRTLPARLKNEIPDGRGSCREIENFNTRACEK